MLTNGLIVQSSYSGTGIWRQQKPGPIPWLLSDPMAALTIYIIFYT
jgi:hypothetical protein